MLMLRRRSVNNLKSSTVHTLRSVTTVRRASGRPQGVSGPALLLENLPLASGLASRLTWSEVWA